AVLEHGKNSMVDVSGRSPAFAIAQGTRFFQRGNARNNRSGGRGSSAWEDWHLPLPFFAIRSGGICKNSSAGPVLGPHSGMGSSRLISTPSQIASPVAGS